MKSKKAQVDIAEVLESPAFWILSVVGYGTFLFMILILKGMKQADIMPLWVKIVTAIAIPIAAAVFASFGD